jgi:hypothetical protein
MRGRNVIDVASASTAPRRPITTKASVSCGPSSVSCPMIRCGRKVSSGMRGCWRKRLDLSSAFLRRLVAPSKHDYAIASTLWYTDMPIFFDIHMNLPEMHIWPPRHLRHQHTTRPLDNFPSPTGAVPGQHFTQSERCASSHNWWTQHRMGHPGTVSFLISDDITIHRLWTARSGISGRVEGDLVPKYHRRDCPVRTSLALLGVLRGVPQSPHNSDMGRNYIASRRLPCRGYRINF